MDDLDLIVSELFNNKYNIDTTRLKNWNYSSHGFYYITIVTEDRMNYFGKIVGNDYYSKIPPKPKSISAIIRSFKSVCTKMINIENKELKFAWQPRFYDRIIRNDNELNNVREYIRNNILKHRP